MAVRESEIEAYLKSEVKKLGGFCRKYTSPGVRGVPDQIVFLPGMLIFAELKTNKGVLSMLQKREIKRMRDLGHTVVVLNSKEAVDICLGNLMTLQTQLD